MKLRLAVAASLALLGCVTAAPPSTQANTDAYLARMMAGESAMQGSKLDTAFAEVSQYQLGSIENPVRASMQQGQPAYLSRLRSEDLTRPEFTRAGNVGGGPFGNIVDACVVTCNGITGGRPA